MSAAAAVFEGRGRPAFPLPLPPRLGGFTERLPGAFAVTFSTLDSDATVKRLFKVSLRRELRKRCSFYSLRVGMCWCQKGGRKKKNICTPSRCAWSNSTRLQNVGRVEDPEPDGRYKPHLSSFRARKFARFSFCLRIYVTSDTFYFDCGGLVQVGSCALYTVVLWQKKKKSPKRDPSCEYRYDRYDCASA